ncbi:glycolate oxidase subunit GlcF [Desertibaculum subflavum]|uniref:glycolate oxidase subunit GlcF n=1 Tax=Desertibaculum subflavum TaxID=2268458 RepID=UPI000E673719
MQTHFTPAQLEDPGIQVADKILRACVHCGFCTATCPTFVLLGDERDSPRGRIYLIKEMLEQDLVPSATEVTHIDRCLSCLSCMTTCPSGVHYMHLVDHARARIEEQYERPAAERWLRRLLAILLVRPALFRAALVGAMLAWPLRKLFRGRLRAMLDLAPRRLPGPSASDRPQSFPAQGRRRKRVALLTGCAQRVLAPEINEATIRLLTRLGCEVVVSEGVGCCGALPHHMGQEEPAFALARANVEAWSREIERGGLDAIVINASGCGTTVKDYGFMLRLEPGWAERAAKVSAITRDVSELLLELGLGQARAPEPLKVAYHAACSLQHGQKITAAPKQLLAEAGFTVLEPPEGHLCCGSAGTYNLLQPELAGRLRDRKVANIERTAPDVVAAGNIGCITQIAGGTALPVVHTVELLDWATGGPRPGNLGPAGLGPRNQP